MALIHNGEQNEGLYGFASFPRVVTPSITVSARGTIGYTAVRTEPFVPIVRLITLIPNLDLVDLRYLFYAVQNYSFSGSGTSIPQLTVPMLKKYSFPVPEKEEQCHIVNLLDQVARILTLRKRQLSKLDELVKSRFVEMFGDPVRNPMSWETALLKNATSKIGSGATPKGGKESYQAEGITLSAFSNCEKLEYIQFPSTYRPFFQEISGSENLNTIVCPNDKVVRLWGKMADRKNITWYVPSSTRAEAEKTLGVGAKVCYNCALL